LLENTITDISPHVLRIVKKDGVGQLQRVEVANPIVMRENLRGNKIRLQSQALNELPTKRNPIHLRCGCLQSIEVSHRACQLGFEFMIRNFSAAFDQPRHRNGDLLPQSGRHRRLTVRARQEGQGTVPFGKITQGSNNLVERRQ
jgi:hypothetical protein